MRDAPIFERALFLEVVKHCENNTFQKNTSSSLHFCQKPEHGSKLQDFLDL